MSSRFTWVPIVLFLVWAAISHHWYVCYIQQDCKQASATAEAPQASAAVAADIRPLVFHAGAAEAITQATFPAFKQTTLDGLKDGQVLEITGLYYAGEKAPAGFANMGLARAEQVKALFVPPLAAERVVLTSRLASELPAGESDSGLITAVAFDARQAPAANATTIVETDDKIAILFPLSSAVQEANPKVDEYLAQLAQRLIKNGESLVITGHTDNSGTPARNVIVGMHRAAHIRDLLVGKGMAHERIRILSEGAAKPVASNDSVEGRRLNRRVELQVLKQ